MRLSNSSIPHSGARHRDGDFVPVLEELTDGQERAKEFLEFHHKNPAVYAGLCRLAREALDAGKTRGSMQLFFERLRWEDYLKPETTDPDYLLNNNLRPFYARFLIFKKVVPPDFFELRTRKDD